jgi:hypothetical protein
MPALVLRPADIVVFLDERFPNDSDTQPGEMQVNRVAVVVDEHGALSLRPNAIPRLVEVVPLQNIPALRNLQVRSVVDHHSNEIAQFFITHANRPTHFEAGLRALHEGNLQPLIAGGFFPKRQVYTTDGEYQAAWHTWKANLAPLDFIFTRDLKSRLSNFIAWATDGEWSHAALHVGDGEIAESVTSGIRRVPVELYEERRYWVAAYRRVDAAVHPKAKPEVDAAVRSHHFRLNAYNYRGALTYGWKAFRGDHSHALTPNSQVLQGNLMFMGHV